MKTDQLAWRATYKLIGMQEQIEAEAVTTDNSGTLAGRQRDLLFCNGKGPESQITVWKLNKKTT